MKFGTLVAILAISSLLPIFAHKQGNNKDMAGSTCEKELGQCIDITDSHECMSPLAKLDCPDGKKCCKIFSKDYDSADLAPREERCGMKCPTSVDSNFSTEEISTHVEYIMNLYKRVLEMAKNFGDQHKQSCCALRGYLPYEDSCYFISSSKENWENAQKKCVEKGGNLVKIDDDKEFKFLQEKITGNTWIGLSDIQDEGQFIWVADGSPLTTQTWWFEHQPDNWDDNENCGLFWRRSDGDPWKLNDGTCTNKYLYICEMLY